MPLLQQNFLPTRYSTVNCKLYFCKMETFRNHSIPTSAEAHGAWNSPVIPDFQNSSGINISTKSVHWELHGIGFHCRAASVGNVKVAQYFWPYSVSVGCISTIYGCTMWTKLGWLIVYTSAFCLNMATSGTKNLSDWDPSLEDVILILCWTETYSEL